VKYAFSGGSVLLLWRITVKQVMCLKCLPHETKIASRYISCTYGFTPPVGRTAFAMFERVQNNESAPFAPFAPCTLPFGFILGGLGWDPSEKAWCKST
jgi:hypothetical protein